LLFYSGLAVALLIGAQAFPGHASVQSANAASDPSSCPSSDVLHVTMDAGTPNSNNLLTMSGDGAFATAGMNYEIGLYPQSVRNGSLDWNLSAVDWIKSNSNYTIWQFNIKPGLHWSDGTPVTANDSLGTYSKSFALNPLYDPLGVGKIVSNEYALNSSTAVFVLNQSDAQFPWLVSPFYNYGLMPPLYYKNSPSFTGFGVNDPTMTAYYEANYSVTQQQLTEYKNPFFGPSPGPCELQFNFVETTSQTPTYLVSGATDITPIDPEQAAVINSTPGLHVAALPYRSSQALAYDVQVYPYNMTAFRQALLYSINQTDIGAQAYNGLYTTAYSSQGGIPPVDTSQYNPNQNTYSYNPQTALSLLNSIGIKMGSDNHLQYPNGTDVSLNIWADQSATPNILAGELISNDLQNLGFVVSFHPIPPDQLAEYWSTNQFGVQHSLVLARSDVYFYASGYLDSLPGVGNTEPSFLSGIPIWEAPASAQAEFMSNSTAYASTDNVAQDATYLNNIQAINAQYLPDLILGFPETTWGYSTQHFTNWPADINNILLYGHELNTTALAELKAVASTSSSSSSMTGSQSPASSSSNLTTIAILAVVVVIIVVGAVVFLIRRRPQPK
jgi:ABC-type transport system substrate-binding protein